jgi:hypothetical protein
MATPGGGQETGGGIHTTARRSPMGSGGDDLGWRNTRSPDLSIVHFPIRGALFRPSRAAALRQSHRERLANGLCTPACPRCAHRSDSLCPNVCITVFQRRQPAAHTLCIGALDALENAQGLLPQFAGTCRVPQVLVSQPQVGQPGSFIASVPDLAGNRQRLLVGLDRPPAPGVLSGPSSARNEGDRSNL